MNHMRLGTLSSFSSQNEDVERQVSVKVKLSTANEATRLSSHGWRVWPGAQILSQWLVSYENLKEMNVVEACRAAGLPRSYGFPYFFSQLQ